VYVAKDNVDAYNGIISLRAVRHFEKRPVSGKTLSRILEAGRWAGSAKNVEPWHFIVVKGRDTLERLAGCGWYAGHMKEADVAVVIISVPGRFGAFDCGRAAQNMMLAAWSEGVGSCIAALHNIDRAGSILGVPKDKRIEIAISFGYPRKDAPLTIEGRPREEVLKRIGRRPLSEIVHWEKW
jgi:nitroreductase